jgi:hypothetical protein
VRLQVPRDSPSTVLASSVLETIEQFEKAQIRQDSERSQVRDCAATTAVSF